MPRRSRPASAFKPSDGMTIYAGRAIVNKLPPLTHPVWKRLISGEKVIRSSNVGFNMLVFNCTLKFKNDGSPARVNELCAHAHAFCEKYAGTLTAEIAQLLS